MGFFSKGQKKDAKGKVNADRINSASPDLPSLPDLPPELPKIKNAKAQKASPLPSLPNSNIGNELNQASVKDAVTHGKLTREIPEMHQSLPPNPVPPKNLPPMISYPPEPLNEPRSIEMSEWEHPREEITRPAQPLFIKLDTFEKAVSSFNEIKLRVGEIESLLRNIRDLKNKEEAELGEWEHEIEEIKSRLEQINHEIFDKIE